MLNDQLLKATACCTSILRRYRDGERTATARDLMVAEVETLIGWLLELNLPPGMTAAQILEPVENHLLCRYGHEAGRRLNAEFVEIFEAAGMELLACRPNQAQA